MPSFPEALLGAPEVRWVHRWPPAAGVTADWPRWLSSPLRQAAARQGITRPWRHQVQAAEAAYAGRHVVLATPTASGKTLGYLMPVLAATAPSPASVGPVRPTEPGGSPRSGASWDAALRPSRPATALYLAPTKALAHDQLRRCTAWGLPDWRVTAVDGDSEPSVRDWAREHATYVLTNPDLLHCSVLPNHARWARFLSALRYVVVDEAHRYSGVFGAQVSAVLRRLRRLCSAYGGSPTFLLASATTADPDATAAALIGVGEADVAVVDADSAARGPRTLALWQPQGAAEDDAASLLARLVASGRQTVVFTASRRGCEMVARRAAAELVGRAGDTSAAAPAVPRVEAYRAGYLATDRRRLERDLQAGTLRGVAATSALELGVDVAGLDAVVLAGYPGSRAAFWQQAGRAGRGTDEALVVLVLRRQPLDAYLLDHAEAWLAEPAEATVLHPDNPYVLGPQLAAAAQERPLTEADEQFFGPSMLTVLAQLEQRAVLRHRRQGWFWTHPGRAVDGIDLRTAGPGVEIVEAGTGRVLGDVDASAADSAVHPGAVYLHAGDTYLVDDLDVAAGEALVRPASPGYLTSPQSTSSVRVLGEIRSRALGGGRVVLGEVEVARQVIGYLRRDAVTGTVWDTTPLDQPVRTLRTSACWWTLDPDDVPESWSLARLRAAVHAAEHAATLILPLYARCDRWDVAGVPAAEHPDTDGPTVFLHDGPPGGAGFAERAYAVAERWLGAALERVGRCGCSVGCPACVISPTCGSANRALDKQAAVVLLHSLLGVTTPTVSSGAAAPA